MPTLHIPQDYDESKGDSYSPLPSGEYQLVIEKCQHRPSKSGKMMYAITLAVSGSRRKLFDNIITDETHLAEYPKSITKLASLLRACQVIHAVAPGQDIRLPEGEDMINREVYADVGIDKRDPDKNVVWAYHREAKANRASKTPNKSNGYAPDRKPDYNEEPAATRKPVVEGKHPDTGEELPF